MDPRLNANGFRAGLGIFHGENQVHGEVGPVAVPPQSKQTRETCKLSEFLRYGLMKGVGLMGFEALGLAVGFSVWSVGFSLGLKRH